jgi:adenosylcobinamide kinase/adenosylcobinamide-phosphate guanylyltransferase
MKELILGGVRSGKSRLAEARARESGLEVIYLATARALDDAEMQRRIEHHRRQRPVHWQTFEEPVALADCLLRLAANQRCIIVECLTMWLTNLLCEDKGTRLEAQREALLAALLTAPGYIILVSNECGLGISPLGELTRRFVDEAGQLHQRLASLCDRVTLSVAGLPLSVKS